MTRALWLLVALSGCAFEDFLDTARTDAYHLTDKGIPSEDFTQYELPVGQGRVQVVHVEHALGERSTVFFCSGASANIETAWARAIVWYGLGFDVLLFDYRGFGASSGSSFSEESLYDDAEAVLSHAIAERAVDPAQVVVYGHSLGGAVAAEVALRRAPALLVLESAFTSLSEQIRAGTYFETPDSFWSEFELDSEAKLGRMGNFHKLILHGQKDPTWPVWNAHELFDAATPAKHIALCKGCGHRTVPFHDPAWYERTLCTQAAAAMLKGCW